MSRTFNDVRPALFEALCEMTGVRWKPEEPFFRRQFRIHTHPYLVQVITDDHAVSIKIYDDREISEPLFKTHDECTFPTNLLCMKKEWDAGFHLIDNNFRLLLVMTRIFSILLPEDTP